MNIGPSNKRPAGMYIFKINANAFCVLFMYINIKVYVCIIVYTFCLLIIVFEDPNKIPPAAPATKKPCNGNENENEKKEETPLGQADAKESANQTEAETTAETPVDQPTAANASVPIGK